MQPLVGLVILDSFFYGLFWWRKYIQSATEEQLHAIGHVTRDPSPKKFLEVANVDVLVKPKHDQVYVLGEKLN